MLLDFPRTDFTLQPGGADPGGRPRGSAGGARLTSKRWEMEVFRRAWQCAGLGWRLGTRAQGMLPVGDNAGMFAQP